MTENEELSEQEKASLREYLGVGATLPEERHNTHSFLNKVATARDTTKVGNLDKDELGMPRINLRTLKEMALIAGTIMANEKLKEYYTAKGEILTSTSLSKNATLINLAVIQKRQIEDIQVNKVRQENKGWFKKKDDGLQGTTQELNQ